MATARPTIEGQHDERQLRRTYVKRVVADEYDEVSGWRGQVQESVVRLERVILQSAFHLERQRRPLP